MDIICLDFETYFDDEYSLKKMTTEAYVRDPRFEVHGCAIRWNAYPDARCDQTLWYDHDLKNYLLQIDWEKTACLCHHAQFDGLILSHHYGIRPAFWLDTLSMGRMCFGADVSLSLESLARHLNLAPKSVPYDLFKGKHWHELPPAVRDQVADGACHDVELTWQCAQHMLAGDHPAVPYAFPPSELKVVDLTIRMFTEPTLVGDIEALAQVWIDEELAKQALLDELGVTAKELRSDARFAEMLEAEGVELETKITNAGNEKYAFAKSDYFMQDLATSEDERVALLVEARLKAQSSIYQTRAERLGWMATRGPMCVYLAYAAAHTRRWGGGDKLNWQNFPRSDPAKPKKGALRRAIKAPC